MAQKRHPAVGNYSKAQALQEMKAANQKWKSDDFDMRARGVSDSLSRLERDIEKSIEKPGSYVKRLDKIKATKKRVGGGASFG